jgi:hypothetical protein
MVLGFSVERRARAACHSSHDPMRGRTGGFCPPTSHERLVKKRSPRRRAHPAQPGSVRRMTSSVPTTGSAPVGRASTRCVAPLSPKGRLERILARAGLRAHQLALPPQDPGSLLTREVEVREVLEDERRAARRVDRARWAGVLGELAVAQGATLTAYAAFECPLTGRVLGTEGPGPARAFHHEPKNPMTPFRPSLVPPVAP